MSGVGGKLFALPSVFTSLLRFASKEPPGNSRFRTKPTPSAVDDYTSSHGYTHYVNKYIDATPIYAS